MRLKRLLSKTWTLFCPLGQNAVEDLDRFLLACSKGQYANDVRALAAIFDETCAVGPERLPAGCRKKIKGKDSEGLWEFRTRKLRILWFLDPTDSRLICCTHGFVKKDEKQQQREISTAQRIRQRYLDAKAEQTLEVDNG